MNEENPLTLSGLHRIRKISWQDLQPGMVVLHGINLNGRVLPELEGFPVLSSTLLEQLFQRYRLLYNRQVIVAHVLPGFRPYQISEGIEDKKNRIMMLNRFRKRFSEEKRVVLRELGLPEDLDIPLFDTECIERDYLIKDHFNSFSFLYGQNNQNTPLPSLFDHLDLVFSMGDLLTNQLTGKFNIPEDKEVMLHLVVDSSRSMESGGKLSMVISALEFFQDYICRVMKKTKIQGYIFSDSCKAVDLPFRSESMKGGNTNYASFMKKVLHLRDREIPNKVIVFTDGKPTDRPEALRLAQLLRKNKMDYTQLIFDIREEQREEIKIEGVVDKNLIVDSIIREEDMNAQMERSLLSDDELDQKMKGIFEEFTQIAETAGGNQIILKINRAMKILSLECYDRYMGQRSL